MAGAGSAIFLELGELTTSTRTFKKRGEVTFLEGEVGLMLEWSWRVEGPRAIQFGSWSTNPRITRGVASLVGHTVVGVELEGRLPELVLTLDRNRWLHTFMTAEGQPQWAIRMQDQAWLGVNRGHLYRHTAVGMGGGGEAVTRRATARAGSNRVPG